MTGCTPKIGNRRSVCAYAYSYALYILILFARYQRARSGHLGLGENAFPPFPCTNWMGEHFSTPFPDIAGSAKSTYVNAPYSQDC